MKSKVCEVCQFWDFLGCTTHEGWPLGGCRKRAPERSNIHEDFNSAVWPVTRSYNWCGEFLQKEKELDTNN